MNVEIEAWRERLESLGARVLLGKKVNSEGANDLSFVHKKGEKPNGCAV